MSVINYLSNIPYGNVEIIMGGAVIGDRFTRAFYGWKVTRYTVENGVAKLYI